MVLCLPCKPLCPRKDAGAKPALCRLEPGVTWVQEPCQALPCPGAPVKPSIWGFTQGLRALVVVSLSLVAGHLSRAKHRTITDVEKSPARPGQWAAGRKSPKSHSLKSIYCCISTFFLSTGDTLLLMSTTGLPNAVPLLDLHIVAVSLQHKEKAIPQTSHSPVSWEGWKPFLSPRTGLGDPVGISRGRGDASWAVRSYFKLWQRKKRYTDS